MGKESNVNKFNNKKPVTIMNFSGIYEREDFYKNMDSACNCDIEFLDCSDIEGTNCYCDDMAAQKIKEKIKYINIEGIHFIDSGNYHYMTKLWLDKLKKNVDLIVFDHHPDMQQSSFGNILSCGSWIKDSIDSNVFIKRVIVIGVDDNLVEEIDKKYLKNVTFIKKSVSENDSETVLDIIMKIKLENDIYISIDKDVLSQREVKTNWDQGNLQLDVLIAIIDYLKYNYKINGIDICGECDNHDDESYIKRNSYVNSIFLSKIIT